MKPKLFPTNGRLKLLYSSLVLLVVAVASNSLYLASITGVEFWSGSNVQSWFYHIMFLLHLALGVVFGLVIAAFIGWHYWNSRYVPNRTARQFGIALSCATFLIVLTGVLLVRIVGFFELQQPTTRQIIYWLHVATPVGAIWLFWIHRLASKPIGWTVGRTFLATVIGCTTVLLAIHANDQFPSDVQIENVAVASDARLTGDQFAPSLARSNHAKHIPAGELMNDEFCKECHRDVHERWEHSVHKFSSFNNPAYLASIEETKVILKERDGSTQAVRWCAGCHDPVPLFSGRLDKADFDVVNDPTAQAGITCTVCHAMTHVNSNRGNGDYILKSPERYPFANSDNSVLKWINRQLIRAKPELHKKTFLKPFHKTAEFCSTCHKVHLPKELNDYKDFLRGQNHYDSYHLSGVSGHGSRSFYYPPVAKTNCNECHMPAQLSQDVSARPFGPDGKLAVHDHLFPAANTAIPWLKNFPEAIEAHQSFLKKSLRVDLFGIREDGKIDGKLHAPLRPSVPRLQPGKTYLLETVVRTLTLGHHFTQGTSDSNEVWVRIRMQLNGKELGASGKLNENRVVDPNAHRINAFIIDRNGKRIARRNTQDIFTKVYNHQIPPGAGQSIHYSFTIPKDAKGELTVAADVLYRKFDSEYMEFVAEHGRKIGRPIRGDEDQSKLYINDLPITTMASDEMTFTIAVDAGKEEAVATNIPTWQRWNDYGIGLFLKGKAELRQAEEAFAKVEELGYSEGAINLARCYFIEGRLNEASDALSRANKATESSPNPWTANFFVGMVNRQQGELESAEQAFRSTLEDKTEDMLRRKFDFSQDYIARYQLGATIFDQARRIRSKNRTDEKRQLLESARDELLKVLELDSENVQAHFSLSQIYELLDEEELSKRHRELHQRYQPDFNAQDQAVRLARERYPAANKAAEAVTIYELTPAASETP